MVARADSGAMTRGWWPLRTRFSATRTTQFATPLTSGGKDSVMIAILMSSRSPVRCSKLATAPLHANELLMTINDGPSPSPAGLAPTGAARPPFRVDAAARQIREGWSAAWADRMPDGLALQRGDHPVEAGLGRPVGVGQAHHAL